MQNSSTYSCFSPAASWLLWRKYVSSKCDVGVEWDPSFAYSCFSIHLSILDDAANPFRARAISKYESHMRIYFRGLSLADRGAPRESLPTKGRTELQEHQRRILHQSNVSGWLENKEASLKQARTRGQAMMQGHKEGTVAAMLIVVDCCQLRRRGCCSLLNSPVFLPHL